MSRLHSFLSAGLPTSPVRGLVEDPKQMLGQDESDRYGIGQGMQGFSGLDAPPSIGFPHRLFVPEHYESGYAYPLLVWLHSDHSSEYEVDHVMQSLSLRNYVAVGLRGNRSSNRSSQVFRWGCSVTDYALNEECIFHAIEEIAGSMSIDTSRIFLGGFGKGAMLAQWVGLRNPEQVAGVIACNGPFPSNKRALALWKQARGLPVLAMQSSDSKRFGVDQMISTMKTAHRAGLNYRLIRFESRSEEPLDPANAQSHRDADPEFEGSLEVEMLRAANRFMMGIVTGTDIPLLSEPEVSEQSSWLQ
jgi:phospholipase/carboxylesterase